MAALRRDDPITVAELDIIHERGEAAYRAVIDMCNGSRRWRMSVPVDVKRDHDMVIGAALDDLRRLIEHTRAALRGPADPPAKP